MRPLPEGREDAETFRKDAVTQTDPPDGLLPPDSQEFLPSTPPPEDDYSFLDNLFPDDVLQEEETPEVLVPDMPPARGTKRRMSEDEEEAPPREFGRTRGRAPKKTPSYK